MKSLQLKSWGGCAVIGTIYLENEEVRMRDGKNSIIHALCAILLLGTLYVSCGKSGDTSLNAFQLPQNFQID